MKNTIIESIKSAMVDSCNDSLDFTDDLSKKFNAEYLFTVNVAKSIRDKNSYHADPYTIYLEKSRKEFARDCLIPVVFGDPMVRGSSLMRRGTPDVKSGRIDVAVYCDGKGSYMGKQPLCAIELKGFNPPRKKVIEDLKRNLVFHRVSGNTGKSVLELSIFASIHSAKKLYDDVQAQDDVSGIKAKYEGWLSELGDCTDVEINIEAFTVRKELVGTVFDEGEYTALDTNSRHHFIGIIVKIDQKKSSESLNGKSSSAGMSLDETHP